MFQYPSLYFFCIFSYRSLYSRTWKRTTATEKDKLDKTKPPLPHSFAIKVLNLDSICYLCSTSSLSKFASHHLDAQVNNLQKYSEYDNKMIRGIHVDGGTQQNS